MYADAIINAGIENLKPDKLNEDWITPRRNRWPFNYGLFVFIFREISLGQWFSTHMNQLAKEHCFTIILLIQIYS